MASGPVAAQDAGHVHVIASTIHGQFPYELAVRGLSAADLITNSVFRRPRVAYTPAVLMGSAHPDDKNTSRGGSRVRMSPTAHLSFCNQRGK